MTRLMTRVLFVAVVVTSASCTGGAGGGDAVGDGDGTGDGDDAGDGDGDDTGDGDGDNVGDGDGDNVGDGDGDNVGDGDGDNVGDGDGDDVGDGDGDVPDTSCTAANHCVVGPEGFAHCAPGYRFETPGSATNFVCVEIETGASLYAHTLRYDCVVDGAELRFDTEPNGAAHVGEWGQEPFVSGTWTIEGESLQFDFEGESYVVTQSVEPAGMLTHLFFAEGNCRLYAVLSENTYGDAVYDCGFNGFQDTWFTFHTYGELAWWTDDGDYLAEQRGPYWIVDDVIYLLRPEDTLWTLTEEAGVLYRFEGANLMDTCPLDTSG